MLQALYIVVLVPDWESAHLEFRLQNISTVNMGGGVGGINLSQPCNSTSKPISTGNTNSVLQFYG